MASTSEIATLVAPPPPGLEALLDDAALTLIADVERRFGPRRRALLDARHVRWERLRHGEVPDVPPADSEARTGDWKVAPAPPALEDRRCEITGPAEPKMMINALNSGARIFMCCLEDALAPSWENICTGHDAIRRAIRGTLSFTSPEGKEYRLGERPATLDIRPRGWHLEERHVLVDGAPVSASLFDATLLLLGSGKEMVARGSGPFLYLPKLETAAEAELWNDVLFHLEEAVGIPRGSSRVTVLIETILAPLEVEEILYALREHGCCLNAGRWDYIFSAIKKRCDDPDSMLPDRAQITMTVPFMRAYTERLVAACHRRGAHAIGGMAAFIPSRRDAEVNAAALAKVRDDKEREARDGFDGSWVAHPDLVPICTEVFDAVLGERPNQKERLRDDVRVTDAQIMDLRVPGGKVSEAGVRTNCRVALLYTAAWLGGLGAVAIDNLMEDAATAEISRAQLWQWIRHGAVIEDDRAVTAGLVQRILREERDREAGVPRIDDALALIERLVLEPTFEEFLTIPAYRQLP